MLDDINLSKPSHIPQDVWDAARLPSDTIGMALGEASAAKLHVVRQAVASAIMTERDRTGGVRAMRVGLDLMITHPELGTLIWGEHQTRTLR